MNCNSCGAQLQAEEEYCSYCGNITPYGRELADERKKDRLLRGLKTEKQPQQSEQQRERIKFRYVPILLVPVLYVCTYTLYGLYWYISRADSLNALNAEKKLNKWMCVFYAFLCIAVSFFPEDSEGIWHQYERYCCNDLGICSNLFRCAVGVDSIPCT